jgi:hypothetical protein
VVELSRLLTVIDAVPELIACVGSPPYDAETLIVPAALPVRTTAQLPTPALPLGVQLALAGETPAPLAVKLTVPVGVLTVPGDVSVTVAVQLLPWPTATGLAQATTVVVVRAFTVIDALDGPLPLWLVSPP